VSALCSANIRNKNISNPAALGQSKLSSLLFYKSVGFVYVSWGLAL
jgi:hypothetical protein